MTRYDALERERLLSYLGSEAISVHVYETVDSTNYEAKRYAMEGGTAPAVFLAEAQTAGRGRTGKRFYSPEGTGVYLSLLLSVGNRPSDAVGLTSVAAVAVRRAIARVTGVETEIKWVNDLYANGRKVCGILTEGFCLEGACYAIVGVGVNLYTEEFPDELLGIAGGLCPADGNLRNALAARITAELYEAAERLARGQAEEDMAEYRKHSMVLGKAITYWKNQCAYDGIAEAVDQRGHLTVRHADGSRCVLASGEISLRLRGRNDENQ